MSGSRYQWLNSLKVTQLSKLAVAIGVATSGPKSAVVEGIRKVLLEASDSKSDEAKNASLEHRKGRHDNERSMSPKKNAASYMYQPGQVSVLSIDMGIRTLAYAHLTLPASSSSLSSAPAQPALSAWRTVTIAPRASLPPLSTTNTFQDSTSGSDTSPSARESFSPILYASHAYTLLTSLLDPAPFPSSSPSSNPRPTHLLIEQQRFRSAGSPAVTDWALRVGMFEGMLHAVAETLKRERGLQLSIEGVDPKRIAGFWREEGHEEEGDAVESNKPMKRRMAKEVKKEKIKVVKKWLMDIRGRETSSSSGVPSPLATIAPEVQPVVDAYLWKLEPKSKRSSHRYNKSTKSSSAGIDQQSAPPANSVQLDKLDDLADSLLQATAWLKWRQTRERVVAHADADAEEDRKGGGGGSAVKALMEEMGIEKIGTGKTARRESGKENVGEKKASTKRAVLYRGLGEAQQRRKDATRLKNQIAREAKSSRAS